MINIIIPFNIVETWLVFKYQFSILYFYVTIESIQPINIGESL